MSYESKAYVFNIVQNGTDGIIKSNTAPEDTNQLWLDTSIEPNILKFYDGESWIMTNDQSEEIKEIENKMVIKDDLTVFVKTTEINDKVKGTLEEYIQFNGSEITIGRSDSAVKTVIDNDELAFVSGDSKVAWISDSELHVGKAVILHEVRTGSWQTIHEEGVGLIWRKVV